MNILVTGATSGIGKAIAEIFFKNGHTLIITGRRNDRLSEIESQWRKLDDKRILTLNFDVRNQSEVEQAIKNLRSKISHIDVLVNNAGLAAGLSSIQQGDISEWERMIDTNIKGLLYVTRAVSPWMIEKAGGHIINIGSIAGKEVYANGNVYCATKHAVDALNKAMRIDLLTAGVKVSAINPGMVDTEFSLVRFAGDAERAKNVYKGMQPLKAEDIAEIAYWIATQPKHVNINDIVVMPAVQANSTTVIRKDS